MTVAAGNKGVLPAEASRRTPSLVRRMACFVYESLLLFGIGLIPGVLGAVFVAQTGQRHPLQSETSLQVFALILYGIYFVWFWSMRGQTLAMQTWNIRLVTVAGERVTQTRALGRYVTACLVWFAPATILATAMHLAPWPTLGLVGAGVVVYALLALAEPNRQFWHDRICGTRLVDTRGDTRSDEPATR